MWLSDYAGLICLYILMSENAPQWFASKKYLLPWKEADTATLPNELMCVHFWNFLFYTYI